MHEFILALIGGSMIGWATAVLVTSVGYRMVSRVRNKANVGASIS